MQIAFFILILEKTRQNLLNSPLFAEYYSKLFEICKWSLSYGVDWIFHPLKTNVRKFLTEELLS